ncbi:unnamed protein product [Rotaria magnacalcarata]|uniref:Uncharacterized protein n=1 Tax=Rotaria magnacalcarata TaxID=392030 RepID=A0A815CWS2_9BILA|nr:unnamed protein product [Rotaria magnacalcarata]CAF1394147.1 unnamed protein product [Rotaria magnacalcarata]CAF1954816.1 unnamed protein product [Rotaria magnacalcarata]CAF3825926.1 unnamed protein product [Rotaria magnacalcarata]CAF3993298.1 unnamed protein product [Rotaria magnacalcarata]
MAASVISTDLFDQVTGQARIENDGQVVRNGSATTHAGVRCRGTYSSGQHLFRFKIEPLGNTKWMLFGIVNKSAPLSYDPYEQPTAYVWAGNDYVCTRGALQDDCKCYTTDMQMNGSFQFLVDCERKIISLRNERTSSIHELNVDVSKCAFPWQLYFNLYNEIDRARILR